MKKLLILLFILAGCQKMPIHQTDRHLNVPWHPVFTGTSANDGTGDNLRTAFTQFNTTIAAVLDTFGNIYTESQTKNAINDTITARIAAGAPLGTVGFVKADTITKLATKKDLLDILGSGGGITGKIFTLKGITGVSSGIPGATDSMIIHTNFIGKYVDFFRNGLLQRQQPNNTERNGYWFSNIEGELVVRPVFAANENIEIWSTNTILHEGLVPQGGSGGGGEPPATPLLERLISYYPLNETGGTTAIDIHGDNNGTHNGAMVPAFGILGYAVSYDGDWDNTTIPYSAELVPVDSMAVSLWVKISTLPSAKGHAGYAYVQTHSVAPWTSAAILVSTDDEILGFFVDANLNEYWMTYSTPVTVGTHWYHIVIANRGNGKPCELWVNGILRNTTIPFVGTLLAANDYVSLGNGEPNGDYGLGCVIDEVYISRGIDPTGIITLYGNGTPPSYPFIP